MTVSPFPRIACLLAFFAISACATAPPPPPPKPPGPPPDMVMKVEYEQKTRELMEATDKLMSLRDTFD